MAARHPAIENAGHKKATWLTGVASAYGGVFSTVIKFSAGVGDGQAAPLRTFCCSEKVSEKRCQGQFFDSGRRSECDGDRIHTKILLDTFYLA